MDREPQVIEAQIVARTRACSSCLHPLPLTEEYYHRDPYGRDGDGFCPICKVCRRRERQERASRSGEPRARQQLANVKYQMFKKALTEGGGQVIPSNEEMATYLMEKAGDGRSIMHQLEEDYQNTKQGTLMRVKLMQLKLQVLQKAAEARPTISVDQMSDEELEYALAAAMTKAQAVLEDRSGPEQDQSAEGDASVG